jgi:ribosome-associated protein
LAENAKLDAILTWLNEKKAERISMYNVSKSSSYTDWIIVCEGSADLHNKAIASHLIEMAKENKLRVIGQAGQEYGQWVLVDIGDVIVHIFLHEKREYYKIDALFEDLANKQPEEKTND